MRSPLFRLVLSVLAACGALVAQALQPLEQQALAHAAAGRPLAAASAFLDCAAAAMADAATAPDADLAARIEAWVTTAAQRAAGLADAALLQRFDALRQTPFVRSQPLLADRLGIAALSAAGTLLPTDGSRQQALGFLREFWLIGPFGNERGAGYRTALPPEQAVDLDAELPGKRRPVRWRQLPPLGPRVALPLQRLVRPHEQSLAYVAVALLSERAQQVVLELGSTGSVRVFCNGAEVFAREIERTFAFDQDTAVLPLAAGPNLLLLKLCHQEGDLFTFAARLRGLDGTAAAVRASVDRADLTAAAKTTAVAITPPAAALGGRSTWAIGTPRGADALRLAWLWRARAADGDLDRRDAAAAAAATTQLPDEADSWLTLAAAHVRHGRAAADRDENERRRALEHALQGTPDHVDALVELGHLLRSSSKLWRPAKELADRALAVQPQHAGARLLRCACLRDEGLEPVANAELLLAADAADASPGLLAAAADALAREPARALPLRQRLLTWRGGEERAADAAHALARTGATPAALELLRAVVAADPFARNARWQLTELSLAAGDVRAALAQLEAWLRIAPDDAPCLVQAARCWRLLRGQEPDAAERQLALLREALAVEPTRRDDERYAEFLAAEASGSGAADANAFYAPHRVDAAALLAADAAPPADSAANNDALHWLLRQQVVKANGNGTTSSYQHVIARVLSSDGARSLQNYQLPYDSSEQRGRLLACTVFRADGSVQRPALQGARVRLPDLRPGDVVAIEGRVDDLAPSFFGDYFGHVHVFAGPDGSPVRRDELVVLAEPGRDYRVQASNGAPEATRDTLPDGTVRYRWQMENLPRDVPEIRRPSRREYEPVVRMTTYRDWDHFAGWWWNLIKAQLEVTPAMRATVAKLCEGRTTTEAKIAAIYHFVTTDVRYEAWEFGVHGYKPYSTAVIHDRRHGDCKDKALLLCALLGEIGVPCHPVLIFADPLRSTDDLTLAMVQQFNHCIAWLPPHEGRPGRFLDGTAVWHPTDTLPEMDQGAAVLIVDRGRAELRTVPTTTPAANAAHTDYLIELAAAGTANLQIDERPLGNAAVGLREMLATEPARRHEVIERHLVRTFGKVRLQQIDAGQTTDPEAPPHLRTTAELAEIGQRNGAAWQLPSCHEPDNLLALAADTERHRPLLLGPPRSDVQTTRYRLPPGWRPAELPPPVQQDTPFGSFTMRWQREGDSVVVLRELRLLTPRIAAADHAAFRDFASAVRAADTQLVLLQQEAGR